MSIARRFLRGAALSGISTGVALISLLLVAKMVTNALEPGAVAVFLLTLLLADGFNLLSNFGLLPRLPS